MNLMRTLNAVGKAVFVKYYYVFMNMNNEDCIEMFTESYTENSKKNRTYQAKRIFRERMQLEALKIIFNSQTVNSETRKKARQIFTNEIRKRNFFVL